MSKQFEEFPPTEYVYNSLQSINVQFFDIYERLLDAPMTLGDVPQNLVSDLLTMPSGIPYEIRLMCSNEKRERAKYVRALADWLRTWAEFGLSKFQIPNRINHQRIPIFVEHKIFSKDFDSWVNDALRKDCEFVFLIIDDSLEIVPKQNADKIVILKWKQDQSRPIWSCNVAREFWKEIGRVCEKRHYLDSGKKGIFTDETFDNALKRGLVYYDETGNSYSVPNSKAWFLAPKIEPLVREVK